MTNSMKSTERCFWVCGLILLLCFHLEANSKSSKPDSEFSALKAKYPGNPFVSVLQKRDVTIVPDENGVPLMRVKYTQIEMILSENGADFSESKEYFNSKTDVKKFEAYSLVPNQNKYKKIDVPKITKSTEFGDHLYYDDSYCYSFNFPATGMGVKRVTYSEMEIKDPYYPVIFFFANNIPVDHAELTITMPENIKINFHLFGADTSSVQASRIKKGKMITYKWISHQPKVYEKDFLAPGTRYFRPHLIANIASSSYKTIVTNYLGNLEGLYSWMDQKLGSVNQTISPEITQMTDSVVRGITGTTEKVRAIYKWVQNNIKYIAIEDGDNGFVPREASLVLQRRYGDCKDKSSLLTAMIRSIGEKASLVSVGTRELPYKYSAFPSLANADHMVAAWWNNGQPMILDGTSRHNKLEDVPAFIQGKECIIRVGEGQYKLFEIPVADAVLNSQNDTIHLTLDHGLLTGHGHSIIYGETKSTVIGLLERKDKEKQLAFWPAAIFSASDKLFITDIKISDLSEVNNPLNVDFKFQLSDYIILQDKQVYVNMNIEREFNQLDVKTDRTIPIEVESKREHQVVCWLKIPDNMKVNYLPNPVVFDHPLFGFSQNYEQTDNEVRLKTNIYLNSLLVEGKDISAFREMLDALKRAYRQTITLSLK
jgi:transglutaminase-like putative cysteine protease